MNNLGEAFTYAFSDRDWPVKFLVGALFLFLSILLVGIPFVAGYFLEIVRRVARAEPPFLPDWSNLGQTFGRGLIYIVILLIYGSPLILLACCFLVATIAAGIAGGETNLSAVGSLVGTLASCLAFPLSIIYTAVLPIVTIQYAVTGDFGAAFRFGEMWDLVRTNLGNYIVIVLISWAVSNLIAPLGLLLCGVGILATYFYALVVSGYLYGLFYRATHRPPLAEASV